MIDENGIVYVLSNDAMPGLIKIGMTKREELKQRLAELYTTGVPFPFKCLYACEVKDCKKVEAALHTAFSTDRVNPKREFFKMSLERVYAILQIVAEKDVTSTVADDLNQDVSTDEIKASEEFTKTRRPQLNYEEMGIPIGSELKTQVGDQEYIATVYSPRKIMFDGEVTSLTAATKKIRSISYAIQPTFYWTYEGKKLYDIYNETYSEIED